MAVIDASAAAGLIVDLPWSAEARAAILAEEKRIAPSLFAVEIGSTVWQNIRAGVLSVDFGMMALDEVVPIVTLIPDTDVLHSALSMALRERHPIYDCLYLALAAQQREVLFTADMKMAAIARRLGQRFKLFL
ncbi:MAG: type II toxin-antitoxin system VapC family toxin [Bosea sp.]|nr:type II toxin-antitoxin system VapC family toxin [Bosea sp. (in: a-proteobacteria)]